MPAWLVAIGGARALLVAAAVSGVAGIGWWLYDAGRQAARVEGLETTIDIVRERDAIDLEVNRLPDGAAAERLRRDWSRD